MFTSGSTGFPKGAVITHANVLSFLEWSQRAFGVVPDDRLTNLNPLYFDNSVFDFYSALFSGARLVPFSKEEVANPRLLIEKAEGAACTLWFSVPSLLMFLQAMRALDGTRLTSIRRFLFGGEGYPKAKLKDVYEAYSRSSVFYNVYGPTECTCMCSWHHVGDGDFADLRGLPPLGRIADGFSFLVLDDDGRRVDPGETGELCLSGPGVGAGYYNDPVRTAASFVRNPHGRGGTLIYRTGDLVSADAATGTLHFHGRRDNQIKHMGYLIELEEIESALHGLDYIAEAAALHGTANGLSRIVAVIVSRDGHDEERIRRDLRAIVPTYMMPSVFHHEDVLPKNANGKIDRRRLAEAYLR
jgi:D-alanine--poly(phosphoribitol) ligase subunit 1